MIYDKHPTSVDCVQIFLIKNPPNFTNVRLDYVYIYMYVISKSMYVVRTYNIYTPEPITNLHITMKHELLTYFLS